MQINAITQQNALPDLTPKYIIRIVLNRNHNSGNTGPLVNPAGPESAGMAIIPIKKIIKLIIWITEDEGFEPP